MLAMLGMITISRRIVEMKAHRARQTLRGRIGASKPLDGLYDPSIDSKTVETQGVKG